jgi:hypothetical protein
MNLDQHPLPPGYSLITSKPNWKPLPEDTIMLTPMGWVLPLDESVCHTHDGPFATRDSDSIDILEEAYDLTTVSRQGDYGCPSESFSRIAAFWTIYLDHEISPQQVAQMMALLKISRSITSPKRDTFADQAGYTRLAYLLTPVPPSEA